MRILLDECINPRLRLAFPGDEVRTVADMNWRFLTNGRLLEEAAAKFDLFITLDQNLEFQNPLARRPLGILVLVTPLNDLAPTVRILVESATPPEKRSLGRSNI